jgi:hypothetical protein
LRPPSGFSQAQVESLLAELLKGRGGVKDGIYYVMHLVGYEKGEPAHKSDAWYAYTKEWSNPNLRERLNDPELKDHYKEERLLGARKLTFLYVHYGIPSDTITAERVRQAVAAEWKRGLPLAVSTSPDVDSVRLKLFWDSFEMANPGIKFKGGIPEPMFTPANYAADHANSVSEIDRLAQQFAPRWVAEFRTSGMRITGPGGKPLVALSGPPSDTVYYVPDGFLPITYKIDILKKNPVWQDDLKTIASRFSLQSGFTSIDIPLLETSALVNVSIDKEINYPTSDIVLTGIRGGADDASMEGKIIATKRYDNERKYWFDLSFVVPFKSIEELKFNSDDKLVQTAPVEKNRIYAAVAFFPLGSVNTKADNLLRFAPSIIYGMALDKKPWDHHLVGAAVGLKWVQPFIGLAANRNTYPAADGTIDHYSWGWRLTYGIQIPTRGIVSAIKGN